MHYWNTTLHEIRKNPIFNTLNVQLNVCYKQCDWQVIKCWLFSCNFIFFVSGHSLMVSLSRILKSLAVVHSVAAVVCKINISCHYRTLWKVTSSLSFPSFFIHWTFLFCEIAVWWAAHLIANLFSLINLDHQ